MKTKKVEQLGNVSNYLLSRYIFTNSKPGRYILFIRKMYPIFAELRLLSFIKS